MKLLIAMPSGPIAVSAQKVITHDTVKFFIHECPRDFGLYRATEYTTGRSIPYTTFPTMAEVERAARAQIDYHRPTGFRKALSGVLILNS
jgi:hypothetical protein